MVSGQQSPAAARPQLEHERVDVERLGHALDHGLARRAEVTQDADRDAVFASAEADQQMLGVGALLEKWARDAKILDIFEGTQQIQLLIIARQLLGKTSAELR